MKLAIFDNSRLGVVSADGMTLRDVTARLPWPHDPDPTSAWWRRFCGDFQAIEGLLREPGGRIVPLAEVKLRAPVLNPSKVIGCAVNYHEHVAEMRDVVIPRTGTDAAAWLLEFDVFLKAPSSIVGPSEAIVLPAALVRAGKEIHHEAELTLIIGEGGADIPESEALKHILGYTIALDVTERGQGDRSRRKSWDSFTPIGPWITTADEVPDPGQLTINLEIDGQVRQHATTRDLIVSVPGIVAYTSSIMRLEPGDVILTGAPAGVGEIHAGDVVDTNIERLGRLRISVVSEVISNSLARG